MIGEWERKVALLPLLVLFAPLLDACSPGTERSQPPVPVAGGDRPAESPPAVALPEEPDLLAPPLSRDPAAAGVWDWILPSLVRPVYGVETRDRFAGDLAAGWAIEDGGRAARFHLRADRLWEDTTAVSADDVVETYRVYRDRSRSGAWAARLSEIAGVEPVAGDSAAVLFRFRSPLSRERILQLASLPLVQAAQWRAPSRAAGPLGSPEWPVRAAGPFRILEWRRGVSLRLARHPFPPPGRVPAAPELLLRFVPDGRSRAILFEERQVDLAVDLPQAEAVRLRADPLSEGLHRVGPVRIETIVLNIDVPPLSSLDLRRRIAAELELAHLRRAATPHGEAPLGSPCGGFLLEPSPSPPAPPGGGGRSGAAPIEIVYWAADPRRVQMAVEIVVQLGEVGPGWELRPVSLEEWAERIAARRFEAILLGWSAPRLPDIGEIYGSGGLYNLAGLRDSQIDSAIARARSPEADSIPGLWHRVEELARDRAAILFVEKRDRIDAVDPAIERYRPDPSMPTGNLLTIERPRTGARGRAP